MSVDTTAAPTRPGSPAPPGPGRTAAAVPVLRQVLVAFVLLVALFSVSSGTDGGDGFLALTAAHSLVHDGDLDLREFHDAAWYDAHYGTVAVEGRTIDYFPWTTALWSVPMVVLWEGTAQLGLTGDVEQQLRAGTTGRVRALFGGVFAAAAAVLLALVARRLAQLLAAGARSTSAWIDPDAPWAMTGAALVLGLGTSLWSTASRSLWQHGPAVALGAAAVLCALHLVGPGSRRRHSPAGAGQPAALDPGPAFDRAAPLDRRTARLAVGAGVLAALAYWSRPTAALLTLFVVALLGWRRRRALVPFIAAGAATHVVVLAANLVLVGRWIPPYYAASRIGWHDALPEALAANLVSPARGLLVFSPFLVGAGALALASRRSVMDHDTRAVVGLGALTSLAFWIAVSAFAEKWWAGHSIGPRFMSEALVLVGPAALVGIFGARRGAPPSTAVRAAWWAAIGASVVLHLFAANSWVSGCWNTVPVDIDDAPERVWQWQDPQVLAPLLRAGDPLAAAGSDPRCATAPPS